MAAAAPALVRELIGRYAIDCDASGRGLLFAAHSASGIEALQRRQEEWARRDIRRIDERHAGRAGSPIHSITFTRGH